MLSESTVWDILSLATSRGADFAEVYVEESRHRGVELLDSKIDSVSDGVTFGVGIRVVRGEETFYTHSSDDAPEVLLRLTRDLTVQSAGGGASAPLHPMELTDRHPVRVDPSAVSKQDRVDMLRRLDGFSRREGEGIKQVGAGLTEKKKSLLIANSEGLWVTDTRHYSRLRLGVIAQKDSGPQTAAESPGVLGGYEFFMGLDGQALAEDVSRRAGVMAGAGYIEGGVMPVVLGNGFGGVIFHEACGHPLETEAIRKNSSPFADKMGQMVAGPLLTAVDDGTLANHWGSFNVDDEGMAPQRTVLIENGVLRGFLADRTGASKAGVVRTGSGRRESYKYAPVARMRNTYITAGPHTVEEIIASVDYGLYAKRMGGGSVDPSTGEFNFSVQEGYIIRGGQLAEPVRGATLIGKGAEVLPLISMVGNDLALAAGMCGASSGWVPTTVGQPTLKIDRILVGGR
ncbi:MAG: TldD/PmbA family protein [Deltaproteobacteria bacterium]|nr:TldD/PmbA family protein [Deltaproteobacteria bacterium]